MPFRDIKKDFLKINNEKIESFDDDDKTNMKKFRKLGKSFFPIATTHTRGGVLMAEL